MENPDYRIDDTLIEVEPHKEETAMVKLKEMRKTYNLTQKEISDLLDIPLATWQQWERGRRTPPSYTLGLISYALKFRMNEKK